MAANNKYILVVDCTEYNQTAGRNHKNMIVNDVIPKTVETSFSRYEVLRNPVRTIYFDIDGVPDDEHAESFPDEFVKAWAKFMKKSGFLKDTDIKYVRTKNHSSVSHKGFSSHVICYELEMNVYELRDSVIMFGLTEEGRRFKDYVDTCVYSSLRLFKLPNFIGIPMTDPNNYHQMDERDPNPLHYIIQTYCSKKRVKAHFDVPYEAKKAAMKLSQTNQIEIVKQLRDIKQAIVNPQAQKMKEYKENVDKLMKALIENPKVSEHDKGLLKRFIEKTQNDPITAKGLCRIIINKNKLSETELLASDDSDDSDDSDEN